MGFLNRLFRRAPVAPRPTPRDFESLEAAMLDAAQVELGFTHHFASGVYAREMSAPAGALVLGHAHKTDCINIVLAGRARVMVSGSGEVRTVKAGDVFVSPAGVRKLGYVEADLRFLNIHPNPENETDLQKLEDTYVEKSPAFLLHEALEEVELRALVAPSTEAKS